MGFLIYYLLVAQTVKEWPQTENKGKHKPRKQPELSVSAFYTEEGRNVGMCYQDGMGEALLLSALLL